MLTNGDHMLDFRRHQDNGGIRLTLHGTKSYKLQGEITMTVSVFRVLPPTSLWRRLIEILKRRGASRFFQKRQRQMIADMRISFDKILEDGMEISRRADPQESMHQLMKTVESMAGNMFKIQQQMDTMATKVSSQERMLVDIGDVTRELATSLRRDDAVGRLRGSQPRLATSFAGASAASHGAHTPTSTSDAASLKVLLQPVCLQPC